MVKVLAIVSGKGGVGKTTVAINLGLALNNFGRRVVVVDGDLLKPNVGSSLGLDLKKGTIHDALSNNKGLDELIFVHHSGLKCIPGELMPQTKVAFNRDILDGIKSSELVILDAPTGYGEETKNILQVADFAIIVVTPERIAVQEGLKTAKLAEDSSTKVLGVVINRSADNSELSSEDIGALVSAKVIGIIPEDQMVIESLNAHHPIVHYSPDSNATLGFKKLAAQLLGEKYVDLMQEKKDSPLIKLLKKLGFTH